MPLSGKEMLRLYLKAGWIELHKRGSHVKVGKGNLREIIPLHKELARGLERRLLKRLAESQGELKL
jgi:predicted RNA binding protein YcfA (HicA-like mRNA interferase family)